jgi:crossover junction endonuclease MUS81
MEFTVILKIDLREHKIIEQVKNISSQFPDDFKFQIEYSQLDLGDFIFYTNCSNGSKMVCIIERKEIKDLISSLRDNRYKDQKSRLLSLRNSQNNLRVFYVIEDYSSFKSNSNKFGNAITEKQVYPVFTNTMFRDNIPVYHTMDINGTVNFLKYLGNSIVRCYPEMNNNNDLSNNNGTNGTNGTNGANCETEFSLKKPKIQPKDFYKNILLLIPGISEKTSNSIMLVYKDLTELLIVYQKLSEPEFIDIISLIKIVSGDKSRKLGKIMSKKIHEFLKVL